MMRLLRVETLSDITKRVMLAEIADLSVEQWLMVIIYEINFCGLLELDSFSQESIFLASIIFGVNWYEPMFGVLRVWLIEPFMSLFISMRWNLIHFNWEVFILIGEIADLFVDRWLMVIS